MHNVSEAGALALEQARSRELSHFADTDSRYIDLSEEPSVESREISEGVVLDSNAAGRLVGIDIDEASKRVQWTSWC